MAKALYTPKAEADLYEIWVNIAADSIHAADGVVRRLADAADLAASQPLMGVARPELSPTARLLVKGMYIVIYEPQPHGILVVAVVHGMRDPASWLV